MDLSGVSITYPDNLENFVNIEVIEDIPEKIFIIPYRDRIQHKTIFLHYMKTILEGQKYRIYFVEQNDKRKFNRGALKNIGFIQAKQNYPNNYRNISFIFHDIDLIPYKKGLFSYKANKGEAYHYYGFNFLLGGIVGMNGEDFERINGYPNYWAWGWEDNALQQRFDKRIKGKTNRSEFLVINHPDVLTFYHGYNKTTSPTNQAQYQKEYKDDLIYSGIHSIKELKKTQSERNRINEIKVNFFLTEFPEEKYVYRKEKVWELNARLVRESNERQRKNNRTNRTNQQSKENKNNKNNKNNQLLLGGFNHFGKYNMILK